MQNPSGSGGDRALVPGAAPARPAAAQRDPGVSRGRVRRGGREGQRCCPRLEQSPGDTARGLLLRVFDPSR